MVALMFYTTVYMQPFCMAEVLIRRHAEEAHARSHQEVEQGAQGGQGGR